MRFKPTRTWLAATAITLGMAPAILAQVVPVQPQPETTPAAEQAPAPGGPPGGMMRGGMMGERGQMGMQGERGQMGAQAGIAEMEKTFQEADTDKNGALSEAEFLALQKKVFAGADINKDGALDNREYMLLLALMAGRPGPQGAMQGMMRQPGAPVAPAQPAQPGAAQPGAAGQRDMGSFISSRDTNGDGKLSKDEAPERMQERFAEMDTNSDGFLDASELSALGARMGGGRGGAAQ